MKKRRLKLRTLFLFVTQLLVFIIVIGCNDEIAPEGKYKDKLIDFYIIDYNPAWSPDGQWIAFYHVDTIPGKSGIYLISPDEGKIKQWHESSGQYPAWSPDGKWIAFHQNHQIWKRKQTETALHNLHSKDVIITHRGLLMGNR